MENRAQMLTAAAGVFGVALFSYSLATAESPPFAANESGDNEPSPGQTKAAQGKAESSCASCGSKSGHSAQQGEAAESKSAQKKGPDAACGAGKCG